MGGTTHVRLVGVSERTCTLVDIDSGLSQETYSLSLPLFRVHTYAETQDIESLVTAPSLILSVNGHAQVGNKVKLPHDLPFLEFKLSRRYFY